jgi:hypothetical protein
MESPLKPLYWLAVIPYIAILLGPIVHNELHPLILGMPFPLGWITVWVPLTSIIMWIIYALDPATKEEDQP